MNSKDLRKKRTLTYFIEAAQDIINEEGPDSLTIRKVAAKAGYNSATLYHYFENLNQLKMYASLRYVSQYNKEFFQSAKTLKNDREKFALMWDIFIHHSAENPDAFASVFMSRSHDDTLSKIFAQYNELFPEDSVSPVGTAYTFEQYASLSDRNLSVILQILKEENIENTNFKKINDLMIYYYLGTLQEMLTTDDVGRKALEQKLQTGIVYLIEQI